MNDLELAEEIELSLKDAEQYGFHSIVLMNEDAKKIIAALRQANLAQTEIKGHMRVIDELKAEMVICNGCAFRYGAEHKLADGTYSCPVCELIEAQARIAALEKELEILRGKHGSA